jgi:hypothetical protein
VGKLCGNENESEVVVSIENEPEAKMKVWADPSGNEAKDDELEGLSKCL